MFIEVTEGDIRNGVARDTDSCPISLAVTRALGKGSRAYTYYAELCVYSRHDVQTLYSLPAAASRFVSRFDCGQAVEPFTFEAIKIRK